MKIQPIGKRVLVKRQEEMKVTKGGIIIPDTVTEKPMEGTVMATGDEIDKLKVGQRVLFRKFGGVEISKMGDIMFLIMSQDDILGIIK